MNNVYCHSKWIYDRCDISDLFRSSRASASWKIGHKSLKRSPYIYWLFCVYSFNTLIHLYLDVYLLRWCQFYPSYARIEQLAHRSKGTNTQMWLAPVCSITTNNSLVRFEVTSDPITLSVLVYTHNEDALWTQWSKQNAVEKILFCGPNI